MAHLYEHQKEAVRRLRSGSVLCGGVGTGKSRTALAYYVERVCKERHVPLYIITTARKRDTFEWAAECAIFGLTSEIRATKGRDVVIDSWNNIKKYVDVTDAFFIFDEQRVVGKGAWVKAFLKITKRNRWILLTATPGDTWMDYVPIFIANGYFKNRTAFAKRHVVWVPMSKYPQVARYLHEDELEEMKNDVLVTMDYVKPAKQHDIWLTATYNRIDYDKVFNDRWDILNEEPIPNLARYCYLQRYVANTSPCRVKDLEEVFDNHQKLIVFYNFDFELDILRRFCSEKDVPYGEWNGHRHDSIPGEDCWLYLVQYTAGSEGWNCTETNAIFFYSLTYSYKTLRQARGRIDRLNTPFHDLYYYYCVTNAPIDRRIKTVLMQKKSFNERDYASDLGVSF